MRLSQKPEYRKIVWDLVEKYGEEGVDGKMCYIPGKIYYLPGDNRAFYIGKTGYLHMLKQSKRYPDAWEDILFNGYGNLIMQGYVEKDRKDVD